MQIRMRGQLGSRALIQKVSVINFFSLSTLHYLAANLNSAKSYWKSNPDIYSNQNAGNYFEIAWIFMKQIAHRFPRDRASYFISRPFSNLPLFFLCFCFSTRHLINRNEPARVQRWKDQLQLISNLWDTLEIFPKKKKQQHWRDGNVVFSLVRFVASIHLRSAPSTSHRNWRLKNYPDPVGETSIGNWLEPFVIQLHPTTGWNVKGRKKNLIGGHWLSICVTKNCLEIHFARYRIVTEGVSDILLCYRTLSNISSRSHHNGNFNKYRVSGGSWNMFFLSSSLSKLSTILDSRWQQIITIMMNISHFSSFPLVCKNDTMDGNQGKTE